MLYSGYSIGTSLIVVAIISHLKCSRRNEKLKYSIKHGHPHFTMYCIIQILLWITHSLFEDFTKYLNLKASGLWQILRTSSLSIYYKEVFILKFMLSTCTGGTFVDHLFIGQGVGSIMAAIT